MDRRLKLGLWRAVRVGFVVAIAGYGFMAEDAEFVEAVEAAGEVTRLEDVLNRNLATLAGAKHFEQTVMSLAAAIHLLNARLAETPADTPPIKLDPNRGETQAA